MTVALDWSGVLTGQPLQWLASGVAVTGLVTVAGLLVAAIVAVVAFGLRIASAPAIRAGAGLVVGAIRNTPVLVQLLFWYFAGYAALPQGLRDWLIADHPWAALPGGVSFLSPEFLTAAWGLGLFYGVFMAEELRAGVAAVPFGQVEAARSQGLSPARLLVHVTLPQAVGNAWQPLVGQALNLFKFSSLASTIGLAELTYQVRQVESLNARAFEVMAVGTALYLLLGLLLGWLLQAVEPGRRWRRRAEGRAHGA
ncbi:MAG: ABC transporter permease subunit [Caulobacteraceae bacterium]